MPSDFHFDELAKLLGYFGFEEIKVGKTAGSRVRFQMNMARQLCYINLIQTGL